MEVRGLQSISIVPIDEFEMAQRRLSYHNLFKVLMLDEGFETLDEALKHYEGIEDYEMCLKIKREIDYEMDKCE